jgi:hypothetical protein
MGMTVQDRASSGVKPAMSRIGIGDAADLTGRSGKKRGQIDYRLHRADS